MQNIVMQEQPVEDIKELMQYEVCFHDTTHRQRNSIGHDGRAAEIKNNMIQKKIGRPRAKSLFSSIFTQSYDKKSHMHPKLLSVDIAAYGLGWKESERCLALFFLLIFSISWGILISFDEGSKLFDVDHSYWIKLLMQNCFFMVVFGICGFFVVTCDWKDSYSRKSCHVVMYLTPLLVHLIWPSDERKLPGIWEMSWTVWFQFVPFLLLMKPFRRCSALLMLSFRAVDRAQDRPHTLAWILSQLVASYMVLICLYSYLSVRKGLPNEAGKLILIPIIINVFGDGLAEPIGVRFGRHKFRVPALWYDGKCCSGNFHRTYEGSACVYFVTLFSIFPFEKSLSSKQFIALVSILPPIMTLSEAWAPHTWDNPFMTLMGTLTIFVVYELI